MKEASRNLGQQSSAIAGKIGRSRAAVGNSGRGLHRHGDYFMSSRTIRGGDKANAARIVLASGIEGCCRGSGGVSSVMLVGTGRVDPLPIGGHGVSKVVAPEPGEAHAGHKKRPAPFWEQAGGQHERANSTRRSPGADEIEIDVKAGGARCDHGSALLCIVVDPSSVN